MMFFWRTGESVLPWWQFVAAYLTNFAVYLRRGGIRPEAGYRVGYWALKAWPLIP